MTITTYDSPQSTRYAFDGSGDFRPVTPHEIPLFVSNRGYEFLVYESSELDCRILNYEERGDTCVIDWGLAVGLERSALEFSVERTDPPRAEMETGIGVLVLMPLRRFGRPLIGL